MDQGKASENPAVHTAATKNHWQVSGSSDMHRNMCEFPALVVLIFRHTDI